MRLLIALVSYVVFVLALPFLLLHPKMRDGFWQRLGFGLPALPAREGAARIWLHGASAGDVLALRPLAHELRAQVGQVQIIVTTITNSGREMARRMGTSFDVALYAPLDLPGPVHRIYGHIRPDVLVLEYTELWPQLIFAAARRKLPLVLHNGRFAAQNLGRYRFFFRIFGNLLTHFSLLLMRDEIEADRARTLGAPGEHIRVTGNTKFDNMRAQPAPSVLDEMREVAAVPHDGIVWVAGSTHEGEEELLFDIFASLRARYPKLYLLVAPRYVERADTVTDKARARALTVRRRSAGRGPAVDVLVVDTIGELAACYALADVVFVGGSFVTRGGQNILEPAAAGKAVLFGPHMENFSDAVRLLLGRGGIQVSSPAQLEEVLVDLLARPQYRRELGDLGRTQVFSMQGTAARNAALIATLLPAPQRQATT